ncbi:MAG: YggS family pyridoxal phosphate-dependent enzyme [Bacteroidales bacterium]|nr:YggS family pyridoxal phosphate-dependent enzyme [Bacteroidales bacterium]
MKSIVSNITSLRQELPDNVKIVAVSKTKPSELIMEAYNGGQRVFGENRVQELVAKQSELPKDIEWHMIGHLQSNKVKLLVPFISLIHSVDSLKLLRTIQTEAKISNRKIEVLLQVHIAEEEHKFGFIKDEVVEFFEHKRIVDFPNIVFRGLMGMATFTEDSDQVREEFRGLNVLFQQLREQMSSGAKQFSELSMGMSGDYKYAVEEGSTMIRIGSLLFGSR